VSDAAGNAVAIWKAHDASIRVAHFSAVTKTWRVPVALQLSRSSSPDVAMNRDGMRRRSGTRTTSTTVRAPSAPQDTALVRQPGASGHDRHW
jgi:hypothetical protein